MPAALTVAPDSPTRVRLSRAVGNGTGVVAVTIVDCSAGGVGIECPVYLPRHARVQLVVEGDRSGALELEGTVQRVGMISRNPTYYLGLSFRGRTPPSTATIEGLLRLASAPAGKEAVK